MVSACGQMDRVGTDCACGFYTDAAGKEMWHWPEGSVVQFSVDPNFPEEMEPSIVEAGKTYDRIFASTRVEMKIPKNGDGSPYPKALTTQTPVDVRNEVSGDGVNGIYWVDSRWPWIEANPTSDAMTVVKFRRGHIVEADVFFRSESFPLTNISTRGLAASEVEGGATLRGSIDSKWLYVIAVHELGHALGRVHAQDEESVMFPSVGLEFLRQPFSQWDLDVFSQVYSLKN